MRLKTLALGSASLAALLVGTAPAAAQTATPATGTAPEATSDSSEAEQTVVVTGLRRSLQSAQNLKRNSEQQVDAIVAEDIGKLPDRTVSDTAARIPGIQVERSQGEAGRVLVRGLDRFFYTTTYNGREIFTAETRSVALQDFPAGGIAALEAFKTTTADQVEGGIAGLINVRSRRPFDFSRPQVAGSFWTQYEKRSGKFDPSGNLLLTDRWDTKGGELGALINFSYQQIRYLDSTRSNTDFLAGGNINGTPVRYPDIQRLTYNEGKRWRPSINGSLQFRPGGSPNLEFHFDGLWQGFRRNVSDREYSLFLYRDGLGTTFSNLVLRPGTDLVSSLSVQGSRPPFSFQGATRENTDTYQFAAGGRWNAGRLKVSGDIARTVTEFNLNVDSFDTEIRGPVVVNANLDNASTNLTGVDLANPDTYRFLGLFERNLRATGDDWQGRLDAEYELGDGLLRSVQVGARYVTRDTGFDEGDRFRGSPGDVNSAAVPGVELYRFRSGFPGDDPQGFRTWLTPTFRSVRGNVDRIRSFVGAPDSEPDFLERNRYRADENSLAGYAQVQYGFGDSPGIRVDGSLGVRVVKTNFAVRGTAVVGGALTPVEVENDYTDILPNLNARIRFSRDFQLRLSATRTRTRPNFNDLRPGRSVDAPTGCVQNTTTCIRNANGGNPYLDSQRSNNYDASAEYFFGRGGLIAGAVFRRDLKGFIQSTSRFVTDPDFGIIQLSGPFNTSSGKINGVEAQFNSFLDFPALPEFARNFGLAANVTYLDAKVNYPASGSPARSINREIVGISKWTYNIDGFYESGPLTARLSWNWRSSFLFEPFCCGPYREDFNYFNGDPAARLYVSRSRPVGRLDFSASYNLLDWATLTFDATNITAKPLRVDEVTFNSNFSNPANYPRSVRYEESVYSVGFRFRF
jgi:TonB-dependent receptor